MDKRFQRIARRTNIFTILLRSFFKHYTLHIHCSYFNIAIQFLFVYFISATEDDLSKLSYSFRDQLQIHDYCAAFKTLREIA